MPDDHSDVVPLLPIPNRTVKRVSADDSADPRVKVGHRQATYSESPPQPRGRFHQCPAFMKVLMKTKNLRFCVTQLKTVS